jgi:hypothetical protein
VDIINMADWLAARQEDGNSAVRAAISALSRLSRRKRGKTGRFRLTQAQRETILGHTSLPDELVARFIIEESGQRTIQLTADMLSLLQEKVREEALYAKGLVRRQLLRIVEKLSVFGSRLSKRVQVDALAALHGADECPVPIAAAGQVALIFGPVLAEGESRLRMLDGVEKLRDGDAQAGRDPLDVDEADVAGAPLDIAQIGPMDAGLFREVLLRQAQLLPVGLDGEAEALADILRGPPFFH